MAEYILSQIFICLGLSALGASYFVKNYKIVTILCIICAVLAAIGYALLGATTAIFLNALGVVSYIFFYIFKIKNKENPFYFILILWTATIINGVLTFTGPVSLIPTIASLFFYYSVWQKNTLVYRVIGVLASVAYVFYNLLYKSYFGAILQVVLFVFALVGLIYYLIELYKFKAQKNTTTR